MRSSRFAISHDLGKGLLALKVFGLLAGAQVPSAWSACCEGGMVAQWSLLTHFGSFAGVAGMLIASPLNWPLARVALAGVALALVAEALKLWVFGQSLSGFDVFLDLASAFAGVAAAEMVFIARVVLQCCGSRW